MPSKYDMVHGRPGSLDNQRNAVVARAKTAREADLIGEALSVGEYAGATRWFWVGVFFGALFACLLTLVFFG